MSIIIKTKKYGIIHAAAFCTNCNWIDAVDLSEKNEMGNLRNKIYSHIKETGHKVNLETSNSTDYYKE